MTAGAVLAVRPRGDRPVPPTHEEVVDAIRGAHATLRRILGSAVSGYGLIPTEYRALSFLSRAAAPTPTALSQDLGITPASTTELIDRLEERRLVRRSANPKDRRSTLLAVTRAGRLRYGRARGSYRRAVSEVIDRMDPRARAAFAEGLTEFQSAAGASGYS